MSNTEQKSLDEILAQREAREAIVSTEEAEEIAEQERIWAEQERLAKEEENKTDSTIYSKNFDKLPDDHVYADYKDIDQAQLQKDIEDIKKTIGKPAYKDYLHVKKMHTWSRAFSVSGFFMLFVVTGLELSIGLDGLAFWALAILSAILIGVGNVGHWANVAHPVMHGGYDKIPNIPNEFKKSGYARGNRRYLDWLDWIKPEAWEYEHNIMHHYHLAEDDDPDNVERNMQWLIQSKTPMWLRRVFVYVFAATWKFTYYAPNTMRILENKKRRKNKQEEIKDYNYLPTNKLGMKLWKESYLPYGLVRFVGIPLLFFPLGLDAILTALIVMLIAEAYANLHSFLVVVPNHSAGDIYQFSEPHKSQGEFYLRQIMGSVNYNTGSDWIDFLHGFLNYQVEHHLFPNMPLSYYQAMQPLVKEVCRKHNIEYRQESVFKRIGMTVDLMVGETKLLRVDGV
ncbi:MAG: acyl-CoA desaturase [Campylobacterota bacterium]|nr:acyl-CoA desaturase [Campylobacterota bacterium]